MHSDGTMVIKFAMKQRLQGIAAWGLNMSATPSATPLQTTILKSGTMKIEVPWHRQWRTIIVCP